MASAIVHRGTGTALRAQNAAQREKEDEEYVSRLIPARRPRDRVCVTVPERGGHGRTRKINLRTQCMWPMWVRGRAGGSGMGRNAAQALARPPEVPAGGRDVRTHRLQPRCAQATRGGECRRDESSTTVPALPKERYRRQIELTVRLSHRPHSPQCRSTGNQKRVTLPPLVGSLGGWRRPDNEAYECRCESLVSSQILAP